MNSVVTFLGLFLTIQVVCATAKAKTLSCIGEIDPGAHYTVHAELDASNKIVGAVKIGYEDNDGFKFESDVSPSKTEIEDGKSILIEGAFNGGTMKLDANYDSANSRYIGELSGSGSMGEGIDSAVICNL